jgi:hypothetical protein
MMLCIITPGTIMNHHVFVPVPALVLPSTSTSAGILPVSHYFLQICQIVG